MCGLNSYDKHNNNSTDATNFGGGRPIPEDHTINSQTYLYISIDFVVTLINDLAYNFACCCCAHQDNIKELFF